MADGAETKNERFKRGTYPPYVNLGEALSIVRSIYEQGGGQASYDVMSRITGNSSSSSSFLKKLAALKMYGLVTESNKIVFLTEQGTAIAAPTSEGTEAQARKAAFVNVDVFNKIYERHRGKLLPVDEFLKNIIEQDALIPRELSSSWAVSFKESARAAGLLFDRTDGKTQVLDSPLTPSVMQERPQESDQPIQSAPKTKSSEPTIQSGNGASPVPGLIVTSNALAASGNITRLKLDDGRVAEFNVPFGITVKDAKRLKSYLKGLELIIDAAIDDADGSPP
jgi:hypothetical protein